MLLQLSEEGYLILSRFIMVIGFLVISLGALLLLTLVFTRKKQNEFFLKEKKMEDEFQKQLLKAQIEVQETTFSTLGKELHDNIGQLLSTTKMLIGLTERRLHEVPDTLLTANATLSKAIHELRSLSKSLDREWLEQFQIVANIESEVLRINAAETIIAECNCKEQVNLSNDKQIILFRIVQEAMQNAIKHASASKISIRIFTDHNKLFVVVKDNGRGIVLSQETNGVGIMNMKYRAKLLGGEIDWNGSIEHGTTVSIIIPL